MASTVDLTESALPSPEQYLAKARTQFLSADMDASIETLSAGVVAFPDSAQLYFELAKKLHLRSLREKAEGIANQALTAAEAAYALSPRLQYAETVIEYLIAQGHAERARGIVQRISTSVARWVVDGRLLPKANKDARKLHEQLFQAEFQKGYEAEVLGNKVDAANHMFRAAMLQLGGFTPATGPLEDYSMWELL
jgi:hypothetical protein